MIFHLRDSFSPGSRIFRAAGRRFVPSDFAHYDARHDAQVQRAEMQLYSQPLAPVLRARAPPPIASVTRLTRRIVLRLDGFMRAGEIVKNVHEERQFYGLRGWGK